jgi:lipopolysaccharide export system permease protein
LVHPLLYNFFAPAWRGRVGAGAAAAGEEVLGAPMRHGSGTSDNGAPTRARVAHAGRLRPFSLIDRYLLKETVSNFAVGLATFTFVLMMYQILRLTKLVIDKGLGLGVVLRLFLFTLPFSLTITIPMSVLLAVLATYGRLSSDGEAIALKTSGLSLYRLMVPSVLVGAMATLATLWITVSIQPQGARAMMTLLHGLYQTKAIMALEEGVFNTDYPGLVVYVDRVQGRNESLAGILIVDRKNPDEQRIIIAQEGRLLDEAADGDSRSTIQLSSGTIHITSPDNPGRHRSLTFETYELQLPGRDRFPEALQRQRKGREMGLAEISAQIERLRQEGGKIRPLQVEWHKKFALPFACLILSVIGTPLGLRIRNANRGISLALSVVFAVLYYILLVIGESLAVRGRIDAAPGVWFPNLLLGGIALGLVMTEGREAVLPARLRLAARALPVTLLRLTSHHRGTGR